MGQQLPVSPNAPESAPTPAVMPQHRPQASPSNADQVFTSQQVQAMLEARARELQQAADARLAEQSQQVQAMNDELSQLREFQRKQQEAENARQQAAADAQRVQDEEELSAKELLRQYRTESEQQLRQLQADIQARDALLAKERELQGIREHAARRIIEEGDNIMAQFHDYITVGATSIQQVEDNIKLAIAKTAAIVEEVRQAGIRRQSGMQPVGTGSGSYDYPGTAPGGTPPQYTAEQIAAMVPGSEEHLAARRQIAGLGPQGQLNIDQSGFPTNPRITAYG